MSIEKFDFDAKVALHDEIKSFITKNSVNILNHFHNKSIPKFNRIVNEKSGRQNLSSNAVCANTISHYSTFWNEEKIENEFKNLEEYWNYIIECLKKENPNPIEAPDEFSILNILSSLKGIQEGLNEEKNIKSKIIIDDKVKKLILLLCAQYIKNEFNFKENPHPFIWYRFYNIIEDWWPEISEKGKVHKKKLQWFKDKIFQNGMYELYRQISLYYSKDKALFDVKRLIYSVLIVAKNERYSNNLITEKAFEIIFTEQLEQGIFPICHIVNNDFVIGNGKITQRPVSASPLLSSFECFNDILSHKGIKEDVKKYHEKFEQAYEWIKKTVRKDPYDTGLEGWYPEYQSTHVTESWVTGHNLMFIKNYYELLSELIEESGRRYLQATKIDYDITIFDTYGIKKHLKTMENENQSALVFGPPGTGKSTIAKYLAHKLDYYYVELTPGLFLSRGPPNIIPTANEVFKRLFRIKKAVIFFDEVDQLVYSRDPHDPNLRASEELAWIVTALLPKFQDLRKQKEIKFMLATNYIDKLDSAISRPGRIDLILPMGGIHYKDRITILENEIRSVNKKKLMEIIPKDKNDKENYHDSLKVFLNKTNYMSYPRIKSILENILNKDDCELDEQYKFFFIDSVAAGNSYEDDEIRIFQEVDLSGKYIKKVRMPIGENPEKIIEDNIYLYN